MTEQYWELLFNWESVDQIILLSFEEMDFRVLKAKLEIYLTVSLVYI